VPVWSYSGVKPSARPYITDDVLLPDLLLECLWYMAEEHPRQIWEVPFKRLFIECGSKKLDQSRGN
jgi:hypothetical protein